MRAQRHRTTPDPAVCFANLAKRMPAIRQAWPTWHAMVAAIGQPNIQGGTGHKTVFGARWTTAFEDAYGMQFRMARVYARCLTITEMQANWAAIFGEATATQGWL